MDERWLIYSSEPTTKPTLEVKLHNQDVKGSVNPLSRLWQAIASKPKLPSPKEVKGHESVIEEAKAEQETWKDFPSVYVTTHICRSWTGTEIFRIETEIYGEGREKIEMNGAGRIIALMWEGNENIVRDARDDLGKAKEECREVISNLLRVKIVEEGADDSR
jgi:hypothetical protein